MVTSCFEPRFLLPKAYRDMTTMLSLTIWYVQRLLCVNAVSSVTHRRRRKVYGYRELKVGKVLLQNVQLRIILVWHVSTRLRDWHRYEARSSNDPRVGAVIPSTSKMPPRAVVSVGVIRPRARTDEIDSLHTPKDRPARRHCSQETR